MDGWVRAHVRNRQHRHLVPDKHSIAGHCDRAAMRKCHQAPEFANDITFSESLQMFHSGKGDTYAPPAVNPVNRFCGASRNMVDPV